MTQDIGHFFDSHNFDYLDSIPLRGETSSTQGAEGVGQGEAAGRAPRSRATRSRRRVPPLRRTATADGRRARGQEHEGVHAAVDDEAGQLLHPPLDRPDEKALPGTVGDQTVDVVQAPDVLRPPGRRLGGVIDACVSLRQPKRREKRRRGNPAVRSVRASAARTPSQIPMSWAGSGPGCAPRSE